MDPTAPHFAHARDSACRCSPLEGARFRNRHVLKCGPDGTTLRSCKDSHPHPLLPKELSTVWMRTFPRIFVACVCKKEKGDCNRVIHLCFHPSRDSLVRAPASSSGMMTTLTLPLKRGRQVAELQRTDGTAGLLVPCGSPRYAAARWRLRTA